MITWEEIEAEVYEDHRFRDRFVLIFKKYEGQETDETDNRGRVKVTRTSFARHFGIPQQTFSDWLAASNLPDTGRTQERPNPTELARRRGHVRDLWDQGHTEIHIADAVGVKRGAVITDLANLGVRGNGKRSPAKIKKDPPSGTFPWRDSETVAAPPDDLAPSKIMNDDPGELCRVNSPSELIELIELDLEMILSDRFELSLKDRTRLLEVVTKALERMNNASSTRGDQAASRRRTG